MADYYTQDFSDVRLPGEQPNEVDKCVPRFHMTESLRKDDKGNEEIFFIEMVEIITPGDRLSRPIQKVKDEHRRRWPRQYAAFKAGTDAGQDGTPIGLWPGIDYTFQGSFMAAGFRTIEQLAQADDGMLESVPNGALWRKKAKTYLESKRTVSVKDDEIAELRSRLAALENSPKPERKKPGRKPKIQAEAA